MMRGDGGIDEIATQPAKPRQGAILIHSREPAVTDHIGDQDRRYFPGLADGPPSAPVTLAHKPLAIAAPDAERSSRKRASPSYQSKVRSGPKPVYLIEFWP
jgi:hypothetical protein